MKNCQLSQVNCAHQSDFNLSFKSDNAEVMSFKRELTDNLMDHLYPLDEG